MARVASRDLPVKCARVQAEIAGREKIATDNRVDKDRQNTVKYGSVQLLDKKITEAYY